MVLISNWYLKVYPLCYSSSIYLFFSLLLSVCLFVWIKSWQYWFTRRVCHTSLLYTVGKAAKRQIDGVKNKRQDSEFRGIFWRIPQSRDPPQHDAWRMWSTAGFGCTATAVLVRSTHDKRMRGALRINYIHHQEVESQVSKREEIWQTCLSWIFLIIQPRSASGNQLTPKWHAWTKRYNQIKTHLKRGGDLPSLKTAKRKKNNK